MVKPVTHLFLVLLTAASSNTLLAQGNGISSTGTGGSHVIRGHVYLPSGRGAENVQIKLQSFGAGDLSVMTSGNGDFTFRSLAPGEYNVVVDAGKEYEGAEERVFIDRDLNFSQSGNSGGTSRPYTVVIHLQPRRNPEGGGKSSIINAAALAEPPEAARKLYDRALKLAQAGDSKKAVETLKDAISAFPSYALALNELGVQYLKLGQANNAIEPLTAAVKLTPSDFRTNLNLGIALLEAKQFEAAETQLSAALKQNDASPTAHMYLGLAFMSQKKLADAQTELEKAAASNVDQVAKAHYYLGGIYWGNRDYKRAADELETYLKLVPKASDAEKIRGTIQELRSKQ